MPSHLPYWEATFFQTGFCLMQPHGGCLLRPAPGHADFSRGLAEMTVPAILAPQLWLQCELGTMSGAEDAENGPPQPSWD